MNPESTDQAWSRAGLRAFYVVETLAGLFAWVHILTWVAAPTCFVGSLFFHWRWRWLILVVICSFVSGGLQRGFAESQRRMSVELNRRKAAKGSEA